MESQRDGKQAPAPDVSKMRRELERKTRARQDAFAESKTAEDPVERADARTLYERLKHEVAALEARVTEAQRPTVGDITDIDAEVKRTVALLGDLHRFLGRVPKHRLRETFTALGATLTVFFDGRETAKRKLRFPVRAELSLGKDVAEAAQRLVAGPPGRGEDVLSIGNRGDRRWTFPIETAGQALFMKSISMSLTFTAEEFYALGKA